MLNYDTNNRLQEARSHADRLASDMRRSRPLTPDEAGFHGSARIGLALARRVGLLRRRRHAPAYQA
jgi:hypothetical protein